MFYDNHFTNLDSPKTTTDVVANTHFEHLLLDNIARLSTRCPCLLYANLDAGWKLYHQHICNVLVCGEFEIGNAEFLTQNFASKAFLLQYKTLFLLIILLYSH